MERSHRGVAVIGAGPAGLAAAWRLREAGRAVRVYEAASRVGGLLRTERTAGAGADVAVQLLSGGYTETRRLAAAAGQGDRLVAVPGRDALWRGGAPHGLHYGSLTSLVTSGALPARLKLRLGMRYVPFLERHRRVLDLNAPVRAAEAGLDGLSIAEWGREHVGAEFVELLAYPLLAAYYGVAPEETSAVFFHALARGGMDVEVLGVRGGVGALARGLSEALIARGAEIRTDAPVRRLELSPSGVHVATDADTVEHDAVVVAVPPPAAAGLLPGLDLPSVPTRDFATLILATRTPVRTGWFGLSVPRTEPPGRVLAAVCVQAEKRTGLGGMEEEAGGAEGAGSAKGALLLVPAPEVGPRWAREEPGAVLEEALSALDTLLPDARSAVMEARLVRLPDAVRVPEPGHFDRLARFRAASLPDRVAVAGGHLVAPTVEGAVRSGLAAAERLTSAGA